MTIAEAGARRLGRMGEPSRQALLAFLRSPRYEILPTDDVEQRVLATVPHEVTITVTASPRRGIEVYPAPPLLERFAAAGVPFTTASDAHGVGHVADRADDLRAVLAAAGITELQSFSNRRRQAVAVTAGRGS